MSENVLKQSKNYFNITGVLKEKTSFIKGAGKVPMRIEECDIDIVENGQKTGKKIKGQKLFGAVSVQTAQGTFDIQVSFRSHNSRGEENRNWKDAEVLHYDLNKNSYVKLTGSIDVQNYLDKNGEVRNKTVYTARFVQPADETAATGCCVNGMAYVDKIHPEQYVNKDGDSVETGRYVVDCFGAKYDGTCFPIRFFVDSDSTNAIAWITDDRNITTGDTIEFVTERIRRVVKPVRETKATGISARKPTQSSGQTREWSHDELILCEARRVDPQEEEEDDEGNIKSDTSGHIDPEAMKKAIRARRIALEEMSRNGAPAPKAPVRRTAPSRPTPTPTPTSASAKSDKIVLDDYDADAEFANLFG